MVFYDIEKICNEMQKQKPLHCAMTGSGSTLFAFFESEEERDSIMNTYDNTVSFML